MKTMLDRMADKVLIGDACWEWTGARIPGGYGSVATPGGPQVGAHRAMYELLVGPIPDGLHLHHECGNRACVRPDHLQPVGASEHSRSHDFLGSWARETKPTHVTCVNGHAYPADPPGRGSSRVCRPCANERSRRYRAEHRVRLNEDRRSRRRSMGD